MGYTTYGFAAAVACMYNKKLQSFLAFKIVNLQHG